MAIEIRMQDIIDRHFGKVNDFEHAADYTLFRSIEDWCLANVDRVKWRFDYSSTITASGVDIPGRIIFWLQEDVTAFKLKFGC